jgi:hypothetical protein
VRKRTQRAKTRIDHKDPNTDGFEVEAIVLGEWAIHHDMHPDRQPIPNVFTLTHRASGIAARARLNIVTAGHALRAVQAAPPLPVSTRLFLREFYKDKGTTHPVVKRWKKAVLIALKAVEA